MKTVLASLIAVGLIGGSQVLAEHQREPRTGESATKDEIRPIIFTDRIRETQKEKQPTRWGTQIRLGAETEEGSRQPLVGDSKVKRD